MIYLAIAMGGALGATARFALGEWVRHTLPTHVVFPVGTLGINIAGSFVLGVVLRWAQITGDLTLAWRAFLVVGLCGGFTTFSTFSGESFSLLEAGEYGRAGAYMAVSVLTCVGAVALGVVLARALARS